MRLVYCLAAAIVGASAAPAAACTCGCSLERLVENTAVFFIGKPLAQTRVAGRFHYEVEVVSVIKGEIPNHVVVVTPSGGGACAIDYELGKETLIAVRRGAEGVETNLCSDLCARRHRSEIEMLKTR